MIARDVANLCGAVFGNWGNGASDLNSILTRLL
jgi:hypothetical protein